MSKSERLIRRLLLAWLLLLGSIWLTQVVPFPGSTRLSYWLVLAVAVSCPLVAGLLLWLMGLHLREVLHRVRVLRRAAKWKRKPPCDAWFEEDWTGKPR